MQCGAAPPPDQLVISYTFAGIPEPPALGLFAPVVLALGLLGDLQVRNFQEPARRVPYTVAQVLRSHSQEQAVNE